jgi:hypothetical protein
MLVKTITASTLAHSIKLGLATLGFIKGASAPVEAAIFRFSKFCTRSAPSNLSAPRSAAREDSPGVTQQAPSVAQKLF